MTDARSGRATSAPSRRASSPAIRRRRCAIRRSRSCGARRRSPSSPARSRWRGACRLLGGDIAGHGDEQAIGQLIHLRVRVLDEDGAPVGGAVVEIWQANAAGRYIHPNDDDHAPADPNFYGAARLVTDETGAFELRTVKPGAYPVPTRDGWWRPPHIHFSLFGKVWLSRLVTQMYFPGEPLNAQDRILNAVPDAAAREQPGRALRPAHRRALQRARLRAPDRAARARRHAGAA